MSGKGNVIQTGLVSRPDDGRQLRAIFTDGRDVDSISNSAIYIPADAEVPPDGAAVRWSGRHVTWTRADDSEARVAKVGYSFDPARQEC